MSMEETTQQNAAFVEETTYSAQSMKDQTKDLFQQVEALKFEQVKRLYGGLTQPVRGTEKSPARPVVHGNGNKTAVRKPGAGKAMEYKEPVGVAAGNGKDRCSSGDEFKEF